MKNLKSAFFRSTSHNKINSPCYSCSCFMELIHVFGEMTRRMSYLMFKQRYLINLAKIQSTNPELCFDLLNYFCSCFSPILANSCHPTLYKTGNFFYAHTSTYLLSDLCVVYCAKYTSNMRFAVFKVCFNLMLIFSGVK